MFANSACDCQMSHTYLSTHTHLSNDTAQHQGPHSTLTSVQDSGTIRTTKVVDHGDHPGPKAAPPAAGVVQQQVLRTEAWRNLKFKFESSTPDQKAAPPAAGSCPAAGPPHRSVEKPEIQVCIKHPGPKGRASSSRELSCSRSSAADASCGSSAMFSTSTSVLRRLPCTSDSSWIFSWCSISAAHSSHSSSIVCGAQQAGRWAPDNPNAQVGALESSSNQHGGLMCAMLHTSR
jgi:hypothetical protein